MLNMNNRRKENLLKHSALLILLLFLASCSFTPTVAIDDEKPATDATILREGQFQDADASHKGSGSLSILQDGDERIVRFENFQGTAGPGLKVLLVENINGTNQNEIGNYVDLGSLKSTNGNQNYTIPKDVDLSNYTGVMIYCEPFHVVFSRAAFQ